MSDHSNLIAIFERFTRGECSREEFIDFYNAADREDDAVLKELLDTYYKQERNSENGAKIDWEYMFQRIVADDKGMNPAVVVHRPHFLKTIWFRYAAMLLLIAGMGTWLYIIYQPRPQLAVQQSHIAIPADIGAGSNKAVLILADGSRILLDSTANGSIASQGTTNILKLTDGSLTYAAEENNLQNREILYNTISTPKGGQYQIVLPDGSKVWLNSASSIRFPAAFSGNERLVEVTGECYFEVAANITRPFVVNSRETIIQVLGTSFNVNAYLNEPAVRTTLETGSARVNNILLKPGQAYWKGTVVPANMEKDLAWKNGLFNFEGATLHEAMRQLERWYDIEVVYEKGGQEIEVMGKITKGISLNGLLLGFKELGLHYKLEGKKLTIMP